MLLASSLAMKQDGSFYDVAIYAGVGVVLLARERRRLQGLLVSFGLVVLTAVPWQLYTAAHDLSRKDVRPGLGRMRAQTDHVLPTMEGILQALTHPRTTLFAVPLAVVLAIVCVARRRHTDAVPFLLTCMVVLVAIVLIYWNSAVTPEAVLIPALGRILIGLIVLGWLLVPVLALTATAPPSPESAPESPTS